MSCVDVLYRLLLLSLLYRVLEVVQPSRALPREGETLASSSLALSLTINHAQTRATPQSSHTHTKQGDSYALLPTSRSL
jgi:hypothetical protein